MSILEPIVEFVANFFGDVVHAETDKNAKRWLLVGALALVITFPLGLLWGTHIENDGVPFVIWMSLGLSLVSTVAVIRAAKPEQAWTFRSWVRSRWKSGWSSSGSTSSRWSALRWATGSSPYDSSRRASKRSRTESPRSRACSLAMRQPWRAE